MVSKSTKNSHEWHVHLFTNIIVPVSLCLQVIRYIHEHPLDQQIKQLVWLNRKRNIRRTKHRTDRQTCLYPGEKERRRSGKEEDRLIALSAADVHPQTGTGFTNNMKYASSRSTVYTLLLCLNFFYFLL